MTIIKLLNRIGTMTEYYLQSNAISQTSSTCTACQLNSTSLFSTPWNWSGIEQAY